MSFLARLRQQQSPVSPAGLQLCYFLEQRAPASLTLTLRLATVENDLLREFGQPYEIQPAHLQLPPPFINPQDLAVLRTLIQQDSGWIGRSAGDLGAPDDHFLKQIIDTQKSFTASSAEGAKALHWGTPIELMPQWQIDSAGEQKLLWSCPRGAELWATHSIGVVVQGQQVRPAISNLVDKALAEIRNSVAIAPGDLERFIEQYQDHWSELGLPLPRILHSRHCEAHVQSVLACHADDTFSVRFRYTADSLCFYSDWVEDARFWTGEELLVVARQSATEDTAIAQLARYLDSHFAGQLRQEASNRWRPAGKQQWKQLLLEHRAHLEKLGLVVDFAPGFRHAYVAPSRWQVALGQKENSWQLELDLTIDEKKYDLLMLLKRLRALNQSLQGDHTELHIDGKILVLPAGVLGALAEELEDLSEWYGGDGIPRSQMYRLNELRKSLPDEAEWSGELTLLHQAEQLQQSPELLDPAASGVQAELRSYQWLGVCWLQHFKRTGFNGLLADDMGLGKTLQTLAHLSLEEKQGVLAAPALIVAPTSLLSNWAREAKRFCPHLRVHIVHGGQRHQNWPKREPHILITSYNLVVRDLDFWLQKSLSWLVLDEAQAIKNPATQISQSVRQLRAQNRLCLSGTPVENHLGELWALMDFLCPGVLGNQRQFKSYYQKPIEQEGRADRLQLLLQRVAPLLLRRTKNQVARDLPPKTVVQQLIPLGEEQSLFYQQLKREGWSNLAVELEKVDNPGQKQILLLTALTRLRQACCDPKLLRQDKVSSAKTEYCLEMLQSLVAEGRAALVFSQFTSMLDILAEELEQRQISYLKLTGQSRNRAELVEAFQKGEAPVFLISLKAGGVGLNLTRADTVIHFDPWWNAAAEEQAADRAHRIGQTQPVFVYKLIAENTIEEKIAQLQENKALLSAQVNRQAQDSGIEFALKLEDLLRLWQDDEVSV